MSDYINRQAAIENSFEVYTKEYGWCEVVGVDAINELPPAQPDVPDTNVGDMISRQAVIESIQECADAAHSNHEWDMEQGYRNAIECVEEAPSAQPGWIPTSERLPKPNEYENDVQVYYLVQNEYGDMMVCSWNGSYWTRIYRNTKVKDKVVAWMPLPTPYREVGQDEQN